MLLEINYPPYSPDLAQIDIARFPANRSKFENCGEIKNALPSTKVFQQSVTLMYLIFGWTDTVSLPITLQEGVTVCCVSIVMILRRAPFVDRLHC
jgi:hypothetical protein